MVKINKLGVVLQKTTHNFECEGVLNPPYFIRKPTTNSRIVQIEGTFYLTYTAYDGTNALGTLATSTDLIH
jgi:predicted GH43/DUF377 family glycosyl hydrolase